MRLGDERSFELNIVLAKAEGCAESNSKDSKAVFALSPEFETGSACGVGLAGFSCGSEFFLFRSGNPRNDCLTADVDVGGSIMPAAPLP